VIKMENKTKIKPNKNNLVKKVFFIFVVVSLFFAAIMQVSSQEKAKYSDMEKEEIGDDDESQEALQEYSGEVLGIVKKKAKFNTIATTEDIAVLNVTVNGKDTRILTRIRNATITTRQNLLNATLIRTINLVVLGNISLKGNLFFEAEKSFGLRRLYGVGSTTSRYVDEGFARLVNGEANVSINPVLRELISGYNVFLSAEGLTRGIYVAEKTQDYFTVKSINPNSNIGFSWMLRGVRKDFDDYLYSGYGKEKGIDIKAEIDFENSRTKIRINGLNKILGLINLSANNNNQTNNSNNVSNQSINLITGNLVDEFGLETDLGNILSNTTPSLPTIGEENNDLNDSNLISNETNNNIISNETSTGLNDTIAEETSVLEFTLYSVDENFIISQVADVTSLSLGEVRKLIDFVYLEPENFEDEIIEPLQPSLDFIEKVNGTVIIRLG